MVAHARRLVVGLLLMLPTLGAGPASVRSRFEYAETHMGSVFKIVLYSPDEPTARRASRAAYDRIAALDAILSDYNPESELMKLCDRAGGSPIKVSSELFEVLERSQEMSERSHGAFDATVGPVVRLWRRARRDRKMPAPDRLAEARALVGYKLVRLDREARTVKLLKPGMKLDLGGIAKGYASGEAIAVLKHHGIDRALVAGAGDIVVSGRPPGSEGWTIGVAPLDPSDPKPGPLLLLKNAAISTAGDAERFVVIDGKRYSHIVDPRTGLGVVDRSSVTVVAPTGALADSLDTAAYVLGPERGLTLIESVKGAAGYIVRQTPSGPQTFETRGFRQIPRAPANARDDSAEKAGQPTSPPPSRKESPLTKPAANQ